ncbi:MAG TPA: HisA/HisF-related TIM barrel protein [Candidatus Baltobacteraceae bacterium]|nr:HisA/HisF-related TIM barrel protein [Candidatus Baltobacteraceae bacterium]
MILRGIDFGPVWDASGVRGFFGEGYWYHRWLKPFGLSFKGSTFVAKTTTLAPRKGNMEMRSDGFKPKRFLPDCIVVKRREGVALNAVGLSGPGAEALFADGRWQKRKEPFFLSFMAVGDTIAKRLDELNGFMRLFEKHRAEFRASVGLQINLSCPNAGHDFSELEHEGVMMLAHAASLRVPLVPKFSVVTPPEVVARIARHQACDAVCVSNTIPWGRVDADLRKKLFGSLESPLAKYGGGGLSGAPLFPIVMDWVVKALNAGFPKPINVGGGILAPIDAIELLEMGAASVFVGSAAFLRPTRVRSIIRAARSFR